MTSEALGHSGSTPSPLKLSCLSAQKSLPLLVCVPTSKPYPLSTLASKLHLEPWKRSNAHQSLHAPRLYFDALVSGPLSVFPFPILTLLLQRGKLRQRRHAPGTQNWYGKNQDHKAGSLVAPGLQGHHLLLSSLGGRRQEAGGIHPFSKPDFLHLVTAGPLH